MIRIDHFRGLESYWEIPGTENHGCQRAVGAGPGAAFLETVCRVLGQLPFIAEEPGYDNASGAGTERPV